uniref:Uncharacterized protein n=1 Tax=Arundo donax TaxID=35708 RepID=A0A0A8YUG7_ARUDO
MLIFLLSCATAAFCILYLLCHAV